MKNQVIFTLFSLVLSIGSFAQDEENTFVLNEKFKAGFILGVNYSNLKSPSELPDTISMYNDFGAKLGLLMEYVINDKFSVSPKAELNFNQSGTQYNSKDETHKYYHAFPISLNFSAHFMYKFSNGKTNPYILLGPNLRTGLRDPDQLSSDFTNDPDLAIDFGIGLENVLKNFTIAPELRYSVGLFNVSDSQIVPEMYFHNIALAINFK